MGEVIQKENVVDDSRFARLTVTELRAELVAYRRRWGKQQVSWRAWKTAERLLTAEIKFRELGPID